MAEDSQLLAGAKKMDMFVDSIKSKAASTANSLAFQLGGSKMMDQKRASEDTFQSKLTSFATGAEELFKSLESSFVGEDAPKTQEGPTSGTDPQLREINASIMQLVDIQRTNAPIGVAG